MESTESSGDLRLTPKGVSSSASPSTARQHVQCLPHSDTSLDLVSEAGAWIQPEKDREKSPSMSRTETEWPPSPSPTVPRIPRYNTQQILPTIGVSKGNTGNEAKDSLNYSLPFGSPYRPFKSGDSHDPNDWSSSRHDTGAEESEEDEIYNSAQASQKYEQSSPASIRTSTSFREWNHSNPQYSVGSHDIPLLGIHGPSHSIPPETGPPSVPPDPSVISDAGLQQGYQQYQQEQNYAWKRNVSDVSSSDIDHSFDLSRGRRNKKWDLQKKIYDALVETATILNPAASTQFLPRSQLHTIISKQSIYDELRLNLNYEGCPNSTIEAQANKTWSMEQVVVKGKVKLKSFRKIFAILVLMGKSHWIIRFLEVNVSDLDLPLIPKRKKEGRRILALNRRGSVIPDTQYRNIFEDWGPSDFINFDNHQWKVLSPFFSHGNDGQTNHYILENEHILPFMNHDESAEFQGGFAKVMMVGIHSDHYDFQHMIQHKSGFAIKQLYKNDSMAFEKERNILKIFTGPHTHNHIISLLATYEQHDKFHFIFYRARSDLLSLWKEWVPKPTITHANIQWMAAQCAGIADGLGHLHTRLILHRKMTTVDAPSSTATDQIIPGTSSEGTFLRSDTTLSSGVRVPLDHDSPTLKHIYEDFDFPRQTGADRIEERYGRHGDLDPENILWYNDSGSQIDYLQGTLKIADFGQARLNTKKSKTTSSPVANKITYRPPECDTTQITRQSYDIWCLGCVYLEFATWMLGGARLLQQFVGQRLARHANNEEFQTDQFFILKRTSPGHSYASIKPTVTKFINGLHHNPNCTNYIHDLLNLIQRDMLQVDSIQRKRCAEIKKALDGMLEKCIDPAYASEATPWVNGNKQTSDGFEYYHKIQEPFLSAPANPLLERRHSGFRKQES